MELRQLKTFRTVATLHSFNQAAAVLNYAQSTVSEQIKALETDLDVRLFKRLGKRIVLTEAGELLLQYAQQMLDIEEEIKAEISGREEPHGSLSIRIPETVSIYYLPPVLKRFHRRFPKIGFSFNSCTYYSLQQEFQSGITNLAFLITDTFQAANLETEILLTLPLVIVAHPSHRLTSQRNIHIQEVKDEPILLPKEDCSYRMIFEQITTREKIEPAVIINFNSIEAIKQCIMTGTGITIIPEIAVKKEIANGLLTVLPWKGKQLSAKLWMIWHKEKWISPTLKAFMDMVREGLASFDI
jgi:DNA-binding transcriptional LysR family regulator